MFGLKHVDKHGVTATWSNCNVATWRSCNVATCYVRNSRVFEAAKGAPSRRVIAPISGSALRIEFWPPPPTPDFLSKDFCLQPGLGWKLLLRKTWSGQKMLPLQFPGLSHPSEGKPGFLSKDSLLRPRTGRKIVRRWGRGAGSWKLCLCQINGCTGRQHLLQCSYWSKLSLHLRVPNPSPLPDKDRASAGPEILSNTQEDVNGEKLTVKKWWIFGVPIFHGLRRAFHGL